MAAKRKRMLVVTPPGYGNVFPVIPFAWALRLVGCDVLVATTGRTVDAVTGAGLPVFDVAPGVDLRPIYQQNKNAYFRSSNHAQSDLDPQPETVDLFKALGDVMAAGLLAAAELWRPDVVIHSPDAAAAPVVASKLNIPSVFLGIGLAQTPASMFDRMYSKMEDACERLSAQKVVPPSRWIDVAPPSLRASACPRCLMQYVPYNGAAHLHDMTFERPGRPLVLVTLGTVVPLLRGFSPVKSIARAAAGIDADFLVTLGVAPSDERETPVRPLGSFPPNVRHSRWVPLDVVMETCTAVIQHGGAGTLLTAVRAGLPQLILPQGSDHFYNARLIARRGAGLVSDASTLTLEVLNELLSSDGLRQAACELAGEIRSMPSPAEAAANLLGLAG